MIPPQERRTSPLRNPSATTQIKVPTSPLDAVAVEHSLVGRTPSLDVPSSPFPAQVHTLAPPLMSHTLVTGTDHVSPSPKPYPSILALGNTIHARPGLSSAPDLGVMVIREDIMATPAPPPQLPPPPDEVIAGPSHRSLDNNYTRDHPPHPSNNQYDIV